MGPAAAVEQQPQTSEGSEAPPLPSRVSKELSANSPEFVPGVPLEGWGEMPASSPPGAGRIGAGGGNNGLSSDIKSSADYGGADGCSECAAVAVEDYGHMMPAGNGLIGDDSYNYMDPTEFFTPVLLESPPELADELLQVQDRRLFWELTEALDELLQVPRGSCRESPWFGVAGVRLQLAFFPTGTGLTDAGDCAVALRSEEKTKLKFELFLNKKSSGMKVMLGKKFSCDFRQPQASGDAKVTVSIEVHENLMYSWFG